MRKDQLVELLKDYNKSTAWRFSPANPRMRFLADFLNTPEIAKLPNDADITFAQFEAFLRESNENPDALFSLAYFCSRIKSVGVFLKFKYGIWDHDLELAIAKIPVTKLPAQPDSFLASLPIHLRHNLYSNYVPCQDLAKLSQTASFFRSETYADAIWIQKLIAAGCNRNLLIELKENNYVINYKQLYINCKRLCSPNSISFNYRYELICMSGEFDALKKALEMGIIPKSVPEKGNHPIHLLAFAGQLEGIKLLQQQLHFDLSLRSKTECNILHYAAMGNSVPVMRFALAQNIGGDSVNADGLNALILACAYGAKEALLFALNELKLPPTSYGRKGGNALHEAVLNENKRGIHLAIKHLNISPRSRKAQVGNNHQSPRSNILHIAAAIGNIDLFKFIHQEFKISFYSLDACLANVLHYSMYGNNVRLMRMLVTELGIKSASQDTYGRNALHHAALVGHPNTIQFCLSELQLGLYDETNNQFTPIYHALLNKATDNVITLRKMGYDVRHQDSMGRTAVDYLDLVPNLTATQRAELRQALTQALEASEDKDSQNHFKPGK